jgi:GH18 family chitinase
MAPFVLLPSYEKRKTVIGHHTLWQWYNRNKLVDPDNVNFTKYTQINYAFFQTDLQGNLYGTDEWADLQLLCGPYLQDAAVHTEDNKRAFWTDPGCRIATTTTYPGVSCTLQ